VTARPLKDRDASELVCVNGRKETKEEGATGVVMASGCAQEGKSDGCSRGTSTLGAGTENEKCKKQREGKEKKKKERICLNDDAGQKEAN
jgi:hypothetical protein